LGFNDSFSKYRYYFDNLLKDKVVISNKLFRGFECPAGCGGCCSKFTLDYFPGSERLEILKEKYPDAYARLEPRTVEYNGQMIEILTDYQEDNKTNRCIHLTENGMCGIYKGHPFTCDFELNKIKPHKDTTYITKQLFIRGWAMKRVDGGKGAKCYMTAYTPAARDRDIRLFQELLDIVQAFKLPTNLIKRVIRKLKLYKFSKGFKIFDAGSD
jgi:Fe-S-cluster containining protein